MPALWRPSFVRNETIFLVTKIVSLVLFIRTNLLVGQRRLLTHGGAYLRAVFSAFRPA